VIPVQIGDPTAMRNAVSADISSHPDLEGLFVLGTDGAMPTLPPRFPGPGPAARKRIRSRRLVQNPDLHDPTRNYFSWK
jgi:hypothetical protein